MQKGDVSEMSVKSYRRFQFPMRINQKGKLNKMEKIVSTKDFIFSFNH